MAGYSTILSSPFFYSAKMVASHIHTPPHPFYPPELNVVGYAANHWSMTKLLTVFFGSCAVYLGALFVVVRRYNPKLGGRELAAVVWFLLSEYCSVGLQNCSSNELMAKSIQLVQSTSSSKAISL